METTQRTQPVPAPRTKTKASVETQIQDVSSVPIIPPKPKDYVHPNKLKVEYKPIPPPRFGSLNSKPPITPPRQCNSSLSAESNQRPKSIIEKFRKSAPATKIDIGRNSDMSNRTESMICEDFDSNKEKVMKNLKISENQREEEMYIESGQVEDKYLTNMNNYIRMKFIDAEEIFITKLINWKKNTTYDYLKTTLSKEELSGYFGLIDELIDLHQEYFLAKFSLCYSISEVCDIFINSETELKMHTLDLWEKNSELYKNSFAKKIHLTTEFYNLPCEQLKIYFKEFQVLETSDLCYEDATKISVVSKLLTKLLVEWLNIENTLKYIKGEKINLKNIGYMIEREKCHVTKVEDGKKKKLDCMDVIFTEEFIILTIYKEPYFNFVEAFPLDKISVSIKFDTSLLTISFGQLVKKSYNLVLRNPDVTRKLYESIKDFTLVTLTVTI